MLPTILIGIKHSLGILLGLSYQINVLNIFSINPNLNENDMECLNWMIYGHMWMTIQYIHDAEVIPNKNKKKQQVYRCIGHSGIQLLRWYIFNETNRSHFVQTSFPGCKCYVKLHLVFNNDIEVKLTPGFLWGSCCS